jgi:hypothetical protein
MDKRLVLLNHYKHAIWRALVLLLVLVVLALGWTND